MTNDLIAQAKEYLEKTEGGCMSPPIDKTLIKSRYLVSAFLAINQRYESRINLLKEDASKAKENQSDFDEYEAGISEGMRRALEMMLYGNTYYPRLILSEEQQNDHA